MPQPFQHSPTSTLFQRFRLLLWKSYLWHKYYWWWTLIEIIARCFVPLYLGLMVNSDIQLTTHLQTHPAIHTKTDLLNTITSLKYVAYSPSTEFTDQLMKSVISRIMEENKNSELIERVTLANERELEEYIVNRSITANDQPMGIAFSHVKRSQDDPAIPHKLIYEVRQSEAVDTRWLIEGETEAGPNKKDSDYWVGGFAALQLLIDEEFIRIKFNDSNWSPPKNIIFQPFPYPEYETSIIEREHLLSIVVFAFVAAEVAFAVPFIASIMIEKQNGVKNLMRIHHMEESLVWLGWFLKAFVVILISVTLTVIFLKIPFKGHGSESARQTNPLVLWTFFLLFSVANLCLILFLSSLCNKATIASLIHMFFHYFSVVVMFIFVKLNLRKTMGLLWPSPSITIVKGIRYMVTAEVHGLPFSWSSIRQLHTNESYMTLLPHYLFYAFEIVFYAMLALFFGFLNPGEFSSPISLLSLFSYFLFGSKHKHTVESHQVRLNQPSTRIGKSSKKNHPASIHGELREPTSARHEPTIRVEGLHKEYDAVHALERVDLEFYENEICVLLGPKNSGKTTLFSILAGSITYDDGYIYYQGLDVSDHLSILKDDLGICFKEDRLFHYMTIEQHLIFFGMLKGLSKSDAEEEAEEYMIKLEMHDERKSPIKKLSKMMKRKLCIAICLIGTRKILILDEPMDGLDYKSKIKIWNLLSDMRTDRTIIVSTSNANEAESLADRVAIMENGFVIAHGTPKYLRNMIGIHYELFLSTKKANFNRVDELVTGAVHATVKGHMDNEIVYEIPATELPKFSHLFESLESHGVELDITNIGLACHSLEHVLMKTGSLSGDFLIKSAALASSGNENDSGKNEGHHEEFLDSIGGFSLKLYQLRMLFWKKILYMVKDYASIIKRIILPSIFAVLLARTIEGMNFHPYLPGKMSPTMYILQGDLLDQIFPQFMLHKVNVTDDFNEAYIEHITSHGATVVSSEGSESSSAESLLNYAKGDLMRYRRELLALFVLKDAHTTKIMYNLWTIHSLPIAISVYSNVLLKRTIHDDTAEIVTHSHPVPSADKGCDSTELFIKALIIFGILFFTFAFLTIDLVLYLFELSNKEIVDGLMYLQIMSGVPVWLYWIATFVFDFSFFIIVIAFRLALFVLLDNYNFFSFGSDFGYFVLVLLLFGSSGLFYVYVFSFFYKPKIGKYYAHAFVFNFACNISVVMCFSFNISPFFRNVPHGMFRVLSFLFLFMPFLNFPWTMLQYMAQWYHNNHCFIICSQFLIKWCTETHKPKPYLEVSSAKNMHGIFLEVIFLLITFIFGLVLFIFMNTGFKDILHNKIRSKKNRQGYHISSEEIDHERDEVHLIKMDESRYYQVSLLVDGLSKNYLKMFKPTVAVEDVSFIAEHGTTFGILGEVEAGKTTLFNMMAAKIVPTKGDVSVEGVQPSFNKTQYFSLVGYCPQTSPLLDKFTGRQMLKLIIALRGVKHEEALIDEWIHYIGLEELQHVKCDLYSNNYKRLLSIALSMVGNPRVIFMDEPTTDVDSLTRRHIYDIIELSRSSGKTVVLGSASSHECELLCDRVTILIDGVMHGIGNTHDMKTSHSLGYFLMIKVHPDITSFREVVRLEKNILTLFSPKHVRLLEEYRSLLHYQIVDHSLPLSVLFQRMEEIKKQNPVIEEYVVSTTTLQDILESFSHPDDFFSSRKISATALVSEQEYQKDTIIVA